MMAATIMSIFILLAMNVIASPYEMEQFLELFNRCSFGMGTTVTLLFIYMSFFFGVIASFAYMYIYLSLLVAFIAIFGGTCAAFLAFTSYLQGVASLKAVREYVNARNETEIDHC